jgi:hypothetical protein
MNWIDQLPTILLGVVALLLIVAVLQKSPEYPAQIHIVENKQQRLNEPETYYMLRATIDESAQVKSMLFTKREIDNALYRASRNPEDINPVNSN